MRVEGGPEHSNNWGNMHIGSCVSHITYKLAQQEAQILWLSGVDLF